MTSRNKIIQSVRDHKPNPVDLPENFSLEIETLDLEDRYAFHLDSIGGKARFFESKEDALNALPDPKEGLMLDDIVRGIHTVTNRAEPDITVIEGRFAVAENGAILVTDNEVPNRVSLFLGQKLIALVSRESLIINMHDAYKLIDLSSVGFAIFIAGPSATADIGQILVRGAHGPSEMEVYLYKE